MVNAAAGQSRFGTWLPGRQIGLMWVLGWPDGSGVDPNVRNRTLRRSLFRPLVLLAAFGGVLAAVTVALWAWYGTTVFFEIVRTGWVSCF